LRYEIAGIWMGLAWGCASAGRPAIQLVLQDIHSSSDNGDRGISLMYDSLIKLLRKPLAKLNLIQIHATDLDSSGNILSVGDPLTQTDIYPLITHLLEPLETRVIVHVNNHTDISFIDPRANVVLIPSPPSSGNQNNNYWANLEYLSEEGEILFVIHSEEDYRWMKSQIKTLNLTTRFTVHMAPGKTKIPKKGWAKKLIKDALSVHLLPRTPFTAIPLQINKPEQQSRL